MKITAFNKKNTSRIIRQNKSNKQLNFGINYTKFALKIDKPPEEAGNIAIYISGIIKQHNLGDVVIGRNPFESCVEMNVPALNLKGIIDLIEKIANINRIKMEISLKQVEPQ